MNLVRFCGVSVAGLALVACGADGPVNSEMTAIDQCLANGGKLSEAVLIDNNAVIDHGEITTLAFSSTGQIALASTDGAIKMWSILGDSETPAIGYDAAFGVGSPAVSAMAYASDGSWIVSGRDTGVINTWDPATGLMGAEFASAIDPIASVDVSPDGTKVAVADISYGGNVRVWSPGTGEFSAAALETELWGVSQVLYLANGQLVLAGHIYGEVGIELRAADAVDTVLWIWDDQIFTGVNAVAVSPDQQTLIAVGTDLIAFFDLSQDVPVPTLLDGVTGELVAVQFTPDGTHFVTVDGVGQTRSYSADGSSPQDGLTIADFVGLRVHPDKPRLIAAQRTGSASVVGCQP